MRLGSLNLVILRTAMVYGPYVDYGGASKRLLTGLVAYAIVTSGNVFPRCGGCIRIYWSTDEGIVRFHFSSTSHPYSL